MDIFHPVAENKKRTFCKYRKHTDSISVSKIFMIEKKYFWECSFLQRSSSLTVSNVRENIAVSTSCLIYSSPISFYFKWISYRDNISVEYRCEIEQSLFVKFSMYGNYSIVKYHELFFIERKERITFYICIKRYFISKIFVGCAVHTGYFWNNL